MRVAVLYNAPTLPADHPDAASEADVAEVAREVASALEREGFATELVPAVSPVSELARRLESSFFDVVFNLIEGFDGRSAGEPWITGLIEMIGIPYTGCPPEAQGLCRSKARAKTLLLGAGLPTAAFATLGRNALHDPTALAFPLLLKPESEDASLGISQASVVETSEALARQVAWLTKRYDSDVLIEAYLPGREFNVGVLDLDRPCALALAEVAYDRSAPGLPILTYDAKWAIGSAADLASPIVCPVSVDPNLAETLATLAKRAFSATGCRDYARVDFRLDSSGNPMILEVNPNPDIGPTAGWARGLRALGLDYDQTLASLVRKAASRKTSNARR